MSELPASTTAAPARLGGVLREAALVLVVGMLVALAANAVSPRGLRLARNYFPPVPAIVPPSVTNSASVALAQRLSARGLQTIGRERVAALLADARFAEGRIVLVDARNDEHYQAGHIPGALQFDHYRAERHLAVVIPACLAAEVIIVYCGGGTCEDSEFAALLLRESGVANEKLFVYEGGFSDWRAAGLPVSPSGKATAPPASPAP